MEKRDSKPETPRVVVVSEKVLEMLSKNHADAERLLNNWFNGERR